MRCLPGNTNSDFKFFEQTLIYCKGTTGFLEQGPEPHRVHACWVLLLCQAQVIMPPVDVWTPCTAMHFMSILYLKTSGYKHVCSFINCSCCFCIDGHMPLDVSRTMLWSASLPVWSEKSNQKHIFRKLVCFWYSTQKNMEAFHLISVVILFLTASNICS